MTNLALRSLLALLVLFAPRVALGQADAGGARGHALVIGCSEYPLLAEHLSPEVYAERVRLNGPVNDTELMRRVLVDALGFAAGDVTVLAGWSPDDAASRPTRANIEAGLTGLAQRVQPGDFAVVYFAGHGAQVAAGLDTLERDGLDEVLLASDVGVVDANGEATGSAPIRDQELRRFLDAIRDAGARVWLVIDACHSGSILRSGGRASSLARLRFLDLELIGESPARGASSAADLRRMEDVHDIVAFHAAQADGSAPEYLIDTGDEERWHGLFTWVLARELTRTRGHIAYDDLLTRLVGGFRAHPCNLALPGASGDFRGVRVVDGESVEREAQLVRTNGRFELDRGRLWGTGPGATWEVLGEGGEVLTRFRSTRVELDRSFGLVEEPEALAAAATFTARWVSEDYAARPTTWAFVDPNGSPLDPALDPEFDRHVTSGPFVQRFVTADPDAADWWVIHEAGRYRLRENPRVGGYDRFVSRASEVGPYLEAAARWSNLVRLVEAPGRAPLPDGLTLTVRVRDGDAAEDDRGRVLTNGARVVPGQRVHVEAVVEEGRRFDVFLYYADGLGRLSQLFPETKREGRTSPRLDATTTLFDWRPFTDDPLGVENLFAFAVEVDAKEDLLDLGALAQGWPAAVRGAARYSAEAGAPEDDLARFVLDVAKGRATRSADGPRVRTGRTIGVESWRIEVGWPQREPLRFAQPWRDFDGPDALPDPLGATRSVTLLDEAELGPGRRLVAQGRERVERVLLDLDPSGDVPCAVFHFADDGNYAYYRRRAGGSPSTRAWTPRPDAALFDRVLVDRDRDGLADEYWSNGDEGWTRETGVRTEWLNSRWFHPPQGRGLSGHGSADDLQRIYQVFELLGAPRR